MSNGAQGPDRAVGLDLGLVTVGQVGPAGEAPVVEAPSGVEAEPGLAPATGGAARGEVIGAGRLDRPAGRAAGAWLAVHPGWVRAGRVLLVLVGVLVALPVGVAAVQDLNGPGVPEVVAVHWSSPSGVRDVEGGWVDVKAGRRMVPAPTRLGVAGVEVGTSVTVVGLAGPGVVGPVASAVELRAGTPRVASLSTAVDCRALPWPVPTDAYRLRVQATRGGRAVAGLVSAGELGRWFSHAVQVECGAWLAEHDLSVTALTVHLDPVQPRATTAITVSNRGTRPAVLRTSGTTRMHLTLDRPAGTAVGTSVSVPPGTSTVTGTISWDDCDGVGPDSWGFPTGQDPTSEVLGLTAAEGPAVLPSDLHDDYGDGSSYLAGVSVSDGVRTSVTGLASRFCAGAGMLLVATGEQALRWDPRTRQLQVRLTLQLPEGRQRIHTATLAADADTNTATPAAPGPATATLLTAVGTRYPAAPTGTQVDIALTYRTADTYPCASAIPLSRLPTPTLWLDLAPGAGAAPAGGGRLLPVRVTLPDADTVTACG